MPTGPDHYREAEKLAALAATARRPKWATGYMQLAQVHATLALAAATALNQAEPGMTQEDWESWLAAGMSVWERPSARKTVTA
jgi:hypothetical protein